ncbi:MAG: hypothetical protein AB1428_09940 [Bacteroidota bacterium]
MASQFIDLLWPLLLLVGWEHVRLDPGNTVVTPLDFSDYPLSHSLLGVAIWGLGFALVYFMIRRSARGAIVLGLCVVSHWLLDLVVHRPDLPLTFSGEARAGIGLWNSFAGTVVVEVGMLALGGGMYLRSTKPNDRIGRYAAWGLVFILLAIYAANLFGPPPPDPQAIAVAGNALWLFVLWAYWADKHRSIVGAES